MTKWEKYIKDYIPGTCDKCGREVIPTNSARLVEDVVNGVKFVKDRHLYPTKFCEGSPSRVRLIESDDEWAVAHTEIRVVLDG